MTDLLVPALGATGGPGGYSDMINAFLALFGDTPPVMVKSIDGGLTSDQSNIDAAIALAVSEQRWLAFVGNIRSSLDTVFPEAIPGVLFANDGMLSPDADVGLTFQQLFFAEEHQIFNLSASGSVIVAAQIANWWARWFGARGNDHVGDEVYNNLAFRTMFESIGESGANANANIGAGKFRVDETIDYGGANEGVAFRGAEGSTRRQGSARPACTLKWSGGALPIVRAGGFVDMSAMAFENIGTATRYIHLNSTSDHSILDRISTVVPSEPGQIGPSEEAIYAEEFNYLEISRPETTVTPWLRIGPYGTSIDITGKAVISGASGDGRPAVIYDDDSGPTVINFRGMTFNGALACQCLIDNWDGTPGEVGVINLEGCDITTNVQAPDSQHPAIKLRNGTVRLIGGKVHQQNQLTDNLILLRNSSAYVEGVSGESISLPLVRGADEAGEQSYVYAGPCPDLLPASTKGIHDGANSTAFDGSRITVTPSAGLARIPLHVLKDWGIAKVVFSSAVEVVASLPGDSVVQSYPRFGQVFGVLLICTSGGPITPTAEAFFHPRGTWPSIPTGQSCVVWFQWDGTIDSPSASELFRSAIG